jgi:hypothetical protein
VTTRQSQCWIHEYRCPSAIAGQVDSG